VAEVAALEERASFAAVGEVEVEQRIVVAVEDEGEIRFQLETWFPDGPHV